MDLKSPPRKETTEREERQQQLRDFMESSFDALQCGSDAVLLIARAPDSLPARILFEVSAALAARNLGARIVFTGAATATVGDAWRLNFDAAFTHEIRILRDPRFLDGHEQLVLGRHSVWFGDCMRRDPDKRDAFTCFVTGSADTVVQTRATFQRVWAAAIPIYVHRLPSADASVQPQLEPEAVQQSNQSRGLPPGSLETLEAWQVSTRH